MLRGLFARRPAADREALQRVKGLAAALLGGSPGTELTVSEIECPDPACPGTETVILVMRPGERTVAAKVGKPASAVTEQDLRSVLVEALGSSR